MASSSHGFGTSKTTPITVINNTGYKPNGTNGQNLTALGYPSSTSNTPVNPSAGQNYTKQGGAGSTSGNVGYSANALKTINNTVNNTKSPSGSGSGSGTKDYSAAYSALLNAYANQNNAEDYYNQMKAAAQNAYNNSMNALNSAYDSQIGLLGSNLDSTKGQLLNAYNQSKQNISDDASNSLKQAYINNMMSQRNLGQQMSAQGLNGGATETTLASMLNNYGNARNNINTTANKNLSNLESNYNDNLANAIQAYNSAVAQAQLNKASQQMSLENALANNQISALGDYQSLLQAQNSDYLDLLKSYIANAKNFNIDPTQVLNTVKGVNVQQAGNGLQGGGTNNAVIQALQNLQGSLTDGNTSTYSDTAIKNYLASILANAQENNYG